MKTNLAILCLSDNYSKYLVKKLADDLDMFFARINDILAYNMIDQNMFNTAGKEYFDKEKEKVVHSVCQYENSVICGTLDIMINNVNMLKENCLTIYLNIDKDLLEKIERKFEFSELSRLHLAYDEENSICPPGGPDPAASRCTSPFKGPRQP